MAQVVGRRGSPIYVVILLVFLVLIAALLAVVFYVQNSDNLKKLQQKEQELLALKKQRDKVQNEQIPALVQKITGRDVAWDQAVKEASDALTLQHAQPYANLGLIVAVKGLNDRIEANLKHIKSLEASIESQKRTLVQKDRILAELKKNHEAQMRKLQQELEAARVKFAKDLADKDEQLKRAVKEKDAIIVQRDQEKARLGQERDNLRVELSKRDAIIAKQREEIWRLKGKGRGKPGEVALRKPDGKVLRALAEQQIVFINLGKEDNIKPGLPFSVYSKETGIPKDGKPKAAIVVVNVGPTTSECRIVTPPKEEPIVKGDLVANVVFDTSRTHHFVVAGEFDLYGEGRTDPLGSRRVRKLIESFGGKVSDTVSVETDFVVLGQKPPRPPQPGENAPPDEWRMYQDKLKKYNKVKQIEAVAIALQIPILNTTRFLAFSGYVPKKRLSE
ncbi:MAG: hypothetical protein B1H04_03410 [Planctomycetales bacterium 4484_123]|nr:MAG: hypothetical protein B1H04_03410 [Planctomycetales bacterium 4484_123]